MLKNNLNDLIFIFNCICYIGFVNLVILYDYELVSTEPLQERCGENSSKIKFTLQVFHLEREDFSISHFSVFICDTLPKTVL